MTEPDPMNMIPADAEELWENTGLLDLYRTGAGATDMFPVILTQWLAAELARREESRPLVLVEDEAHQLFSKGPEEGLADWLARIGHAGGLTNATVRERRPLVPVEDEAHRLFSKGAQEGLADWLTRIGRAGYRPELSVRERQQVIAAWQAADPQEIRAVLEQVRDQMQAITMPRTEQ